MGGFGVRPSGSYRGGMAEPSPPALSSLPSPAARALAFAAMSTDNGVSYGPATQIDPNGPGNQVAPDLAATATGRVDVAYLWDSGLGGVQATAVSANPPLPGATTEAWAQPIVVQGIPAGGATPIGSQLGGCVPSSSSPGRPRVRIAAM